MKTVRNPPPRSPLRLDSLDTSVVGYWQVVGHSIRTGYSIDLTAFRGEPTTIGPMEFSDPFGPKQLSLTFPMITIWDQIGEGDLDWIADGASLEIIWHGPLPPNYPAGVPQTTIVYLPGIGGISIPMPSITGWLPGFRWEGFVASFDIDSGTGLTVTCAGALYQLDRYEAKPEYPPRPYPYEYAITRQFRDKPHLRVKSPLVAWPLDWPTFYTSPPASTPHYLIPVGVHNGWPWTGLLTRSTGQWEAVLTSYIQTILSSMYTAHGRWTMDLSHGRRPLLLHREILNTAQPSTAVIDLSAPGNNASLSMDWSQSLDVVYGQGTALDGVSYTGMEVSSDGSRTYYEPLAYRRQAYPTRNNKWLDLRSMPTEILLQLQQGLDPAGAQLVAQSHLRTFADPGVTGTITVAVDPTMSGVPFSRHLLRAGMDIALPGLLGRPQPVLLHITDSSADLIAGTNTLTVDSKFRDALTVAEVKLRGRDALKIPRMLVAGQYQPPVPDQLIPWNYHKGSGYIPSGPMHSCVEWFDGMPEQERFPWTNWSKKRPPSDPKWRNSYIHIGPADSSNPNNNWAYSGGGPKSSHKAIIVRAAQVAQIRLLQVAAYDRNGDVLAVPFHISFYWSNGASYMATPMLQEADFPYTPPGYVSGRHTPTGVYYPFAKSAWEQYNPDGTLINQNVAQPETSAGFIRGYGTYYEQAGWYPGDGTLMTAYGAPSIPTTPPSSPTGLLVDETVWTIDTTQGVSGNQGGSAFDPYKPRGDQPSPHGLIYCLVYCDAQEDFDVYFLGRMFRVEPGTGS